MWALFEHSWGMKRAQSRRQCPVHDLLMPHWWPGAQFMSYWCPHDDSEMLKRCPPCLGCRKFCDDLMMRKWGHYSSSLWAWKGHKADKNAQIMICWCPVDDLVRNYALLMPPWWLRNAQKVPSWCAHNAGKVAKSNTYPTSHPLCRKTMKMLLKIMKIIGSCLPDM